MYLRVLPTDKFYQTFQKNFLKKIEQKSWHIEWGQLTYKVIEYPKAQVTITIYTLSDDEGWIGV